ncbi:hypothetical protein PZ877_002903 [Listeria innocua]|nr:hypothetical protein [Listeria innocua]
MISIVFLGCSNTNTTKSAPVSNKKTYIDYVSDFKSLDVKTIKEKVKKNDKFYLYIGRETCSYCQIFVPKLYKAAKEKGQIIYYWDVGDLDDSDKISNEFLDHYKVQYTPTLIKFDNEHKYKTIDFDSEKVTVKELEKLF